MNSKLKLWTSRTLSFCLACGGGWLAVNYALHFPLSNNAPRIHLETQPTRVAADLANSSMFGVAPIELQSNVVIEPSSNYSLLGLVANDRTKTGFALLKKEGNDSSVVAKIGKEIEPGVIVNYVSKRQVEIAGNLLSLPQAGYSGTVSGEQVSAAIPPPGHPTAAKYNSRVNQVPSFLSRQPPGNMPNQIRPEEIPPIENFPPATANGASVAGSPL